MTGQGQFWRATSLVSLLCLELFGNSQPAREKREEERKREVKTERERDPGTPTAAAQGVPRAVLVSPGVVFKLARLAEH